jgi:hypothetical protein
VLDETGTIREWLQWPPSLPPASSWQSWETVSQSVLPPLESKTAVPIIAWQFSGVCAADDNGYAQTFLCGWEDDQYIPPLWVGLHGT